jgi:hypothetical protein
LKNSTLRFDSEMVTFTPSSRKTSCSGEGRKSGMTFSSPSGSSVYLILAFIESLASPPVAGSDDSNDIFAVSEAYGQDTFIDDAETVVPNPVDAVRKILRDYTLRVGERELGPRERHAVFLLVLAVLLRIPLETRSGHS